MHEDTRITASAERVAAATARMRETLEQLSDEAAARTPAEGGWSPAEIVTHVGLTNERFFLPVFDGEASSVSPAPPGFTETFSFASIPDRIKTFPHLEPPAGATRAGALHKLAETGERLVRAMRELPADRLTHCATLPFGTLSMQQMAEFAAGHLARHQAQLERLLVPGRSRSA